MDEPVYNSLAEQLRQSGLFQQESQTPPETKNFFAALNAGEVELEYENPPEEDEKTKAKKRLNQYDLDLLQGKRDPKQTKTSFTKVLNRFFNYKEFKMHNGTVSRRDAIFLRIFPSLYKIRVAKEAIKRLSELDIDTETLLTKTIPYGENETRYQEVVKYLNYANEIRLKLDKKL